MSDFIVGFVMGLCSILLIRNVNCGSSQLCMRYFLYLTQSAVFIVLCRYNASLVFGVITMVMYAVLLLENIKIVLCGGDGHYSSSSSSSVNHNKQSSSSQTAGRQSPTKPSQKNDKEKKQKHWPPEEADEAGQSACDIEIELKRKSVWPPLADA
jgi:hypothetical protein